MKETPIFYKENPKNKFWWVEYEGMIGTLQISFDKKKIYNLFTDYPSKFSNEEVAIFKKEQPYWDKFFCGGK